MGDNAKGQMTQTQNTAEPAVPGRRCCPLEGVTRWKRDAGVGHQFLSSSMSIPSERISLTSTLNDSGMPASIVCSPLTMLS